MSQPNTIHVDECLDALDQMFHEARKQKLSIPKDAHMFMHNAILHMAERNGSDELDYKEFVDALQRCASAIEHNESSFFLQPRGRKVEKLVDVIEFVESSEYLGMAGKVWPSIKDILWDVFEGPRKDHILEIVLGGATGCGKSFCTELGLSYMLYDLSTYHSPQLEFGLAPGSSIYFLFQSTTLDRAKKVLFEQMSQRIRLSPYFSKEFQFNKEVKSALHFPNSVSIIPIAAGDASALGMNVLAAGIDEANFMERTDNSKKSRFGESGTYDQAQSLYSTMMGRITSRFMRKGVCAGKLFLLSSAAYPGDFIDRKVQEYYALEARGVQNPIYVSLRSRWEAIPRENFLAEEFLVEVGDSVRKSRIIEKVEDAIDQSFVKAVPMDFLPQFQRGIEEAIRDVMGIPVGGSNMFFRDRERIELAGLEHKKAYEGHQLFIRDRANLADYEGRLSDLLDQEWLNSSVVDPSAMFVIHLDLAYSGDTCGIAIGHYGGAKQVGTSFNYDEDKKRYLEAKAGPRPFIVIDGVLGLVPPDNSEIDLNMVGDLVELIASRINVEIVSADSFQSVALLQRFRRFVNCKGKRLRGQTLSVDRTIAPYASLKESIRDERVVYPNSEYLKNEIRNLQFDARKMKVDHLESCGKDISDPVAAVTHTINTLNGRKAFQGDSSKGDGVRRIRTGRRNIQ